MKDTNNYAAELGERVLAAMYEENVGMVHKRKNIVAERAMEAKIIAAEKKVEVCPFRNKYGWCKLDLGHEGSHTVINLGEDD